MPCQKGCSIDEAKSPIGRAAQFLRYFLELSPKVMGKRALFGDLSDGTSAK